MALAKKEEFFANFKEKTKELYQKLKRQTIEATISHHSQHNMFEDHHNNG